MGIPLATGKSSFPNKSCAGRLLKLPSMDSSPWETTARDCSLSSSFKPAKFSWIKPGGFKSVVLSLYSFLSSGFGSCSICLAKHASSSKASDSCISVSLGINSSCPTDFNSISTDSEEVASDQTLLCLEIEQVSAAVEPNSIPLLPREYASIHWLSSLLSIPRKTSVSTKLSNLK
ncbi:hypothetical protein V8G54_001024 [Vigna mungo]|uniref:Uncharacterized protein n=1 Tax=Vigna mungo TaxID=3915 RepID=A0AAQ3P7G4_VIGMU